MALWTGKDLRCFLSRWDLIYQALEIFQFNKHLLSIYKKETLLWDAIKVDTASILTKLKG